MMLLSMLALAFLISSTMNIVLWVALIVVLVLFLARRKGRKSSTAKNRAA